MKRLKFIMNKFIMVISNKSCPVMSVIRFILKKIIHENKQICCSYFSNVWTTSSKEICLIEKEWVFLKQYFFFKYNYFNLLKRNRN